MSELIVIAPDGPDAADRVPAERLRRRSRVNRSPLWPEQEARRQAALCDGAIRLQGSIGGSATI